MAFKSAPFRYIIWSACLVIFPLSESRGKAPRHIATNKHRVTATTPVRFLSGESESRGPSYKWNVNEKGLPLLNVTRERLRPGFDQALTYPAGQFDFSIFKSLQFDDEQGKYLLPVISKSTRNLIFVEFARTAAPNTYTTGYGLELTDKGNVKIIQTADGTRFLFVEYPDGEFRCATIRESGGGILNLLYTANGLALHGLVDAGGRSVTFNYGKEGIQSLTQTWMSNLEGFTKTWSVEDDFDSSFRFAHAVVRTGKFLPANAVVRDYIAEMLASDQTLARVFGGPSAVAGGNGFEPAGLGASYPCYRGDVIGDDGKLRLGHLSHAIHLYGSADGRGDSPLYIPAGFTSHSTLPVSRLRQRNSPLQDCTYTRPSSRIGVLRGPGPHSSSDISP